jgi:hypothetical protein
MSDRSSQDTSHGPPGEAAGAAPAPTAACPDLGRLASLLAPAAAAEADDELVRHLDECADCRRRLDELAGGTEWLDRLLDRNVARDAETRVSPAPAPEPGGIGLPPELRGVMSGLRVGPPTATRAAAAGAHGAAGGDVEVEPGAEEAEAEDPTFAFLTPCELPGYRGRLGQYNVIEIVGRGGMGVVLKAHDPSLDRIVAIKVLSPVLAASPAARKRFVREARAAAAVSHPHVVTIHAVDEANGLPYLVMQFIGGRSLDRRLRATGPLRLEEILRIGMQMAAGLAAAHSQGLVHRDIKPANVMLENGVERVKITDFGLARAADDAGAITLPGQVSGTPHYMAPEQARGERVDHRADLFSLGGVLYAMCTGRAPFEGSTALSTLRKVCEDEPRPVRQVNEEVPPFLVDVIKHLMHKDPARRPQSAQEVADLLGRHLARLQRPAAKTRENADTGSAAPQPRRRRHRRASKIALTTAFVLAACAVTFALTESTGVTRWTAALFDPSAAGSRGRTVVPTTAGSTGGDGAGAGLAGARDSAAAMTTTPTVTTAPAAAASFILLADAGGEAATAFATLAEAVVAAGDGATIEVALNGRHDTLPVDVGRKSLCIRAAKGYKPVLHQTDERRPIVTTAGPLTLEGLAFEGRLIARPGARPRADESGVCLVQADGGALFVSHCRFTSRGAHGSRPACVGLHNARTCEIRNSELYALRGSAVHWKPATAGGATLTLRNCLAGGRVGVAVQKNAASPAALAAHDSSFAAGAFAGLTPASRAEGLTVTTSYSVLSIGDLLFDPLAARGSEKSRTADVVVKHLETVIDLDRRRGFSDDDDDDGPSSPPTTLPSTRPATQPATRATTGSSAPDDDADEADGGDDADEAPAGKSTATPATPAGRPGFMPARVQFGGDVWVKLRRGYAPPAADFRIQSIRIPGRGFAPRRRFSNLGARVDSVGPGAAYDAFQKSAAYGPWRQMTEGAAQTTP